jgi:hypothetical protein
MRTFMQTFSTEARNKNCSPCGRIADYRYIADFRTLGWMQKKPQASFE